MSPGPSIRRQPPGSARSTLTLGLPVNGVGLTLRVASTLVGKLTDCLPWQSESEVGLLPESARNFRSRMRLGSKRVAVLGRGGTVFMRVVRNAKRVSVLGGGVLVVASGVGLWRTAVLLNQQQIGRVTALTGMFAVWLFIQGCIILLWDRRSTPTVLMRPQPADALWAILPVVAFGSLLVPLPEVRDPANLPFWLLILVLGSLTLSVKPAESAPLSEIPPLHSMSFLDWVRIQNFGTGSLFIAAWFTVMYFTSPLRTDTWTPLVVTIALAQRAVSVWRIVEQHQVSKAGLRLSGMQITWLRAMHVNQGEGAAVKELRLMYPKIGTTYAERVIENLYRTQEEH